MMETADVNILFPPGIYLPPGIADIAMHVFFIRRSIGRFSSVWLTCWVNFAHRSWG